MRTAALPPPAAPGRVLREQLRTTFAAWRYPEGLALAGWAVLSLAWTSFRLLHHPGSYAAWPLPGGAGWAQLNATILAVPLATNLWGRPSQAERGVPTGRRGFLAAPFHRPLHDRLRVLAGLGWLVGISAALLAVGALWESALVGRPATPDPATWTALALSPGLVLFVVAGDRARPGRVGWMAVLVLLPVALLATRPESAIPADAAFVYPLVHGPLGIVTGFTGGSLQAVLLWGAVFGGVAAWTAGGIPSASPLGAGSPTAAPAVRERWRSRPASVPPWTARAERRPSLPDCITGELKTLPATFPLAVVAGLVAFSGYVSALMTSDAGILELSAHWAAFTEGPFRWVQAALLWLMLLVIIQDHDRLAPVAFQRMGALSSSRRAYVLGRVAVLVGTVLAAAAAAGLLALAVLAASGGVAALPASGQVLTAGGLVLLTGLLTAAVLAATNHMIPAMFLGGVAVVLLPLLGSAAVVSLTGGRFERTEVIATLFLGPALRAEPHAGTALALALWIGVAACALWVAAGVRHHGRR